MQSNYQIYNPIIIYPFFILFFESFIMIFFYNVFFQRIFMPVSFENFTKKMCIRRFYFELALCYVTGIEILIKLRF